MSHCPTPSSSSFAIIRRTIGTILLLIGIVACAPPPPQANSLAAPVPTTKAVLASISPASEADMPVAKPTALPSPTPEPTPPTGHIIKGGNLRTEPRIAPETVIGQLCVNDTVDFLSMQTVDDGIWYRVRVTGRAKDCTSKQVAIGTEGWVSTILVSAPSYAVEQYAQAANIMLPTAIVAPTATPKPTAAPKPIAKPTAVPQPVAAPSTGGGRIGAVCRDGSHSNATGRGACSHHGGVDHWLYQ